MWRNPSTEAQIELLGVCREVAIKLAASTHATVDAVASESIELVATTLGLAALGELGEHGINWWSDDHMRVPSDLASVTTWAQSAGPTHGRIERATIDGNAVGLVSISTDKLTTSLVAVARREQIGGISAQVIESAAALLAQVRARFRAEVDAERKLTSQKVVAEILAVEPTITTDEADRLIISTLQLVAEHFGAVTAAWAARVPGGHRLTQIVRSDGTTRPGGEVIELSPSELAGLAEHGFVVRGNPSGSVRIVLPLWPRSRQALIVIDSHPDSTWSPDDIEACQTIARAIGQTAARVEARRAEQNASKRNEFAAASSHIAFNATTDTLQQDREELVGLAREFFDAAEVSVWTTEPDGLLQRVAVTRDGRVDSQPLELRYGATITPEMIQQLADSGHGFVPARLMKSELAMSQIDDLGSRLLIVPIGNQHDVSGLIIISDEERRWWANHEVDAAKDLARLYAQASGRLSSDRALRDQLSLGNLVAQISTALVDATLENADDALDGLVNRIRDHFKVASVGLWQLDPVEQRFVTIADVSDPACQFRRSVEGRGPDDAFVHSVRALSGPQILTMGDIERDTGPWPRPQTRLVIVPRGATDDSIWLTLVDPSARDWDTNARGALTTIVGVAAQLIRRIEADARSERSQRIDAMFGAIASDLVRHSAHDAPQGIDDALEHLGETLGATIVSLWGRDGDRETGRRLHSWHHPEFEVRDGDAMSTFEFGQLLTEDVIASFEPMFISASAVRQIVGPDRSDDEIAIVPLSKRNMALTVSFSARPAGDSDEVLNAVVSMASLIDQFQHRVEAQNSISTKLQREAILQQLSMQTIEGNLDQSAMLAPVLDHLGLDHLSCWQGRHSEGRTSLRWAGEAVSRPTLATPETVRNAERSFTGSPFRSLPFNSSTESDLDRAWRHVRDDVRRIAGDTPHRIAVATRGAADEWLTLFAVRPGIAPIPSEDLEFLESVCAIHYGSQRRLLAERRFSIAFDSAPNSIAICDTDGRVITHNRALSELLDLDDDGENSRNLTLEDLLDDAHSLPRVLDTASGPHELGFRRSDGTIVWGSVRSAALEVPTATQRSVLVHIEDVTEVRSHRESLQHQATHDYLTDLPNRRGFIAALDLEQSAGSRFAVLVLDLDRFKTINDSLGHDAGDQMLIECANVVRPILRPHDVLARLGGDEFAILIRSPLSTLDVEALASRVLDALSQPLRLEGAEVFPNASVGIAYSDQSDDAGETLRHADMAMYQAKWQGGADFCVFEDTLRLAAEERVKIDAELRRAITDDQLVLHYQPEYRLDTRNIVGVEALVRWNHPERGLLSPDAFIGHAEETGIIVELGKWVLTSATRQAEIWRRAGHDLIVRVNVSARQLRPAIVAEIREALNQSGLPAARLCLEVTETAMMSDVAESIKVLDAIRALGVELAVDDFGTGFSSLAYLKRLPVSIVKIDRTFVDGVTDDSDDQGIVASIIGMSKGLGIDVVAEGIETEAQLQEIVRLGCLRGQGFFLARPAPIAAIGEALEEAVRR